MNKKEFIEFAARLLITKIMRIDDVKREFPLFNVGDSLSFSDFSNVSADCIRDSMFLKQLFDFYQKDAESRARLYIYWYYNEGQESLFQYNADIKDSYESFIANTIFDQDESMPSFAELTIVNYPDILIMFILDSYTYQLDGDELELREETLKSIRTSFSNDAMLLENRQRDIVKLECVLKTLECDKQNVFYKLMDPISLSQATGDPFGTFAQWLKNNEYMKKYKSYELKMNSWISAFKTFLSRGNDVAGKVIYEFIAERLIARIYERLRKFDKEAHYEDGIIVKGILRFLNVFRTSMYEAIYPGRTFSVLPTDYSLTKYLRFLIDLQKKTGYDDYNVYILRGEDIHPLFSDMKVEELPYLVFIGEAHGITPPIFTGLYPTKELYDLVTDNAKRDVLSQTTNMRNYQYRIPSRYFVMSEMEACLSKYESIVKYSDMDWMMTNNCKVFENNPTEVSHTYTKHEYNLEDLRPNEKWNYVFDTTYSTNDEEYNINNPVLSERINIDIRNANNKYYVSPFYYNALVRIKNSIPTWCEEKMSYEAVNIRRYNENNGIVGWLHKPNDIDAVKQPLNSLTTTLLNLNFRYLEDETYFNYNKTGGYYFMLLRKYAVYFVLFVDVIGHCINDDKDFIQTFIGQIEYEQHDTDAAIRELTKYVQQNKVMRTITDEMKKILEQMCKNRRSRKKIYDNIYDRTYDLLKSTNDLEIKYSQIRCALRDMSEEDIYECIESIVPKGGDILIENEVQSIITGQYSIYTIQDQIKTLYNKIFVENKFKYDFKFKNGINYYRKENIEILNREATSVFPNWNEADIAPNMSPEDREFVLFIKLLNKIIELYQVIEDNNFECLFINPECYCFNNILSYVSQYLKDYRIKYQQSYLVHYGEKPLTRNNAIKDALFENIGDLDFSFAKLLDHTEIIGEQYDSFLRDENNRDAIKELSQIPGFEDEEEFLSSANSAYTQDYYTFQRMIKHIKEKKYEVIFVVLGSHHARSLIIYTLIALYNKYRQNEYKTLFEKITKKLEYAKTELSKSRNEYATEIQQINDILKNITEIYKNPKKNIEHEIYKSVNKMYWNEKTRKWFRWYNELQSMKGGRENPIATWKRWLSQL